jgi:hypothetical protein
MSSRAPRHSDQFTSHGSKLTAHQPRWLGIFHLTSRTGWRLRLGHAVANRRRRAPASLQPGAVCGVVTPAKRQGDQRLDGRIAWCRSSPGVDIWRGPAVSLLRPTSEPPQQHGQTTPARVFLPMCPVRPRALQPRQPIEVRTSPCGSETRSPGPSGRRVHHQTFQPGSDAGRTTDEGVATCLEE